MLIRVLREMANSELNSHTALAKKLELDPELVKQMFLNLETMGYIISDDPSCVDDKCEECGVCCTKKNKTEQEKLNVTATRWKLTEKGKEAVLKSP
ncbi:MAG: transcriptional regulator [Peptococcaceae bacterium]|jgi:DNA-directed RNA polymerase specialized sigma subunit|nr:transcriptional regulator [Peptococcaceae bacterium]